MLSCFPFLLFDGNCKEAMKFYHKCLGGELTLLNTGDSPKEDQFPSQKHHKIIKAHLRSGKVEFSATDRHGDDMHSTQGNTISISIVGDTFEELKTIFDKLAEGANHDKKTFMELLDLPIGTYGHFTDQFGIRWIFESRDESQEKDLNVTSLGMFV